MNKFYQCRKCTRWDEQRKCICGCRYTTAWWLTDFDAAEIRGALSKSEKQK